MTYVLGKASKAELLPVLPELRRAVELAITLTTVDFKVNQGKRTIEEQKDAMRRGTTRTMKSKHLIQPDGWVWAVDLLAWINGKGSWDWKYYYKIAYAMDQAATQLGVAGHVRWGAAWDRVLSDFGGSEDAYRQEVVKYAKRHAGSDLLDGPHFEWVA